MLAFAAAAMLQCAQIHGLFQTELSAYDLSSADFLKMADYLGLNKPAGMVANFTDTVCICKQKAGQSFYKGKPAYSRHKSRCIHIRHFALS